MTYLQFLSIYELESDLPLDQPRQIEPKNFVPIEDPTGIRCFNDDRIYTVIGLTTSKKRGAGSFLYALTITENDEGKLSLAILGWRDYGKTRGCWRKTGRIFYHPWVQEWIREHPAALVIAGIKIGIQMATNTKSSIP